MDRIDFGLTPEHRARLAEKGRILYRKSCGVTGKKTCAESFALFHAGRGEAEVALVRRGSGGRLPASAEVVGNVDFRQ